jgi:glycosyltransferase involved in cell wall biosynthesis
MKRDQLTLVAYTNEVWEHVCPTIRFISPIEQAGLQLIKGIDWKESAMNVLLERISEADAVIIQRDFPNRIAEYEEVMSKAHSEGKSIIYELDDLLTELPEQHPDFYHYQSSRPEIIRAIFRADAAVGSTRAICDYMRQFNSNIWELPNYLDDRFWDLNPSTKIENDPLIIGYMGGHSHSYDLEIVVQPLIRILDEYKNQIKVKFWGLEPPVILQYNSNVEWEDVGLVDYRKFATYFQEQKCDIFLAPLQDNTFNQSKSHLKYLEYSALGVPGIYSRITPYEGVVDHGKNGFLASSSDEWENCIRQLIENHSLRSQMGFEAQSYVRMNWMLSQHVERWKDFYKEIASKKRSSARSYLVLNATRKIQSFHTELDEKLKSAKEELYQEQAQLEIVQNKLVEKDRLNLEIRRFAQQYYDLYHDILNTNSWKVLENLIKIRRRFIPKESKRDRLMRLSMNSLKVLRNEGISPFLRSLKHQTTELFNSKLPPTIQSQIQLRPAMLDNPLSASIDFSLPAISVLIIKDTELPEIDVAKVHNWISQQTYDTLADMVLWDRTNQFARRLKRDGEAWRIENLKNLSEVIHTRYLCIASENLLQLESTYLETNLIALESQSLAFTVNLYGNIQWTEHLLRQGFLPGGEKLPLLRQIVMKECVRNDLSIDISPWLDKWQRCWEKNEQSGGFDFPLVAGRIIDHTTAKDDKEDDLPFLNRINGWEYLIQEKDILFNPENKPAWESLSRLLTPINGIIPTNPDFSQIPTVLVVMPFLAVGGAERVTLDVMQQLKVQLRFVIVTFQEHDPSLGTTADLFRQITPFIYTIPDFTFEIQYTSFMTYLIERLKPSTIYIANGTDWIYNALGSIKESYPTLRIVDQVYDAEVGWINRYDFQVVLNTDGHIGVNTQICQAYIKKGVKPDQVYLIENGVNPDHLNPAEYPTSKILQLKQALGLDPGKKLVSFASRIHPQKRPMDFIELARCFSSDSSVDFLMVGNGPLSTQVDNQINKIGLKNIHRLKFYHPISDVLAISDVLVLPSEFEGMPMIVIESLAMGKPVVVTDVGNNRGIIERTGGGIVLSRIGDVSEMVRAVRDMLTRPPDADQLRRLTLSHFDIRFVAQKYFDVLLGDRSKKDIPKTHDS